MAIYKLGDLLISKPIYGASLKALKKGKYSYFRQSDFGKTPTMFVNETHGKIMKKGDFFISRAGSIDTYFHNSNNEYVYAGYVVKYPINPHLAWTKYIYYWSKGIGKKQIKIFCNSGCVMPIFNPPIALQLMINLPNLDIQKKIIDIIEPKERLYLEHSNCVRIDTINNVKKDMSNLIDIIEPIEETIKCIEFQLNIIKKLEKNIFHKISNGSTHLFRMQLITENKNKINSSKIKPMGIGYLGFVKKHGKISNVSKIVSQYGFGVGLISKNIPIGFNNNAVPLGISTAYKSFQSIDNQIWKSWYTFYELKNNWKKYVKSTSRQGQGFEVTRFLEDSIPVLSKNLWKELENNISNILYIKLELKHNYQLTKNILKKTISYLVK